MGGNAPAGALDDQQPPPPRPQRAVASRSYARILLNAPNSVVWGRMALLLAADVALQRGAPVVSFALLLTSLCLDGVDGLLARRFNQVRTQVDVWQLFHSTGTVWAAMHHHDCRGGRGGTGQ